MKGTRKKYPGLTLLENASAQGKILGKSAILATKLDSRTSGTARAGSVVLKPQTVAPSCGLDVSPDRLGAPHAPTRGLGRTVSSRRKVREYQ